MLEIRCICVLCLLVQVSSGTGIITKYVCLGDSVQLFENVTFNSQDTDISLYMNHQMHALVAQWHVQNSTRKPLIQPEHRDKVYLDEYGNIWIRNVNHWDEESYFIESGVGSSYVQYEVKINIKVAPNKNCKPKIIHLDKILFAHLEAEDCGIPVASLHWRDYPELSDTSGSVINIPPGKEAGTYYACLKGPALECVKISVPSDYCSSYAIGENDSPTLASDILDLKTAIIVIGSLVLLIVALYFIPKFWRRYSLIKDQDQIGLHDNRDVEEKTYGVPEPVQVTSHRESPNPTSYLLMWNKQDDAGSPLLRYSLRYQMVEIIPNKPEYELSRPLSEFIFVDDIPPSDDRYQLEQLNCGRYYQVVIQAVNNQGQSLPQSFIFKTREGVPQPVQVTSLRDSPNPNSYLLTWNKPDDGGSLLQKYSVRYQEVEIIPNRKEYELSRPLSEFISINYISPSDVSYRLAPLTHGSYYQVEIQAINTQGQSTPQSFIFKTLESIRKQEDKEVQTDFQWPDSTPALVSDETNYQLSTKVKLSERNKLLQPRVMNISTAVEETMHESSQWQLEKNKWQKQRVGKDKLDVDEDSDDFSKQPLLQKSGQKA